MADLPRLRSRWRSIIIRSHRKELTSIIIICILMITYTVLMENGYTWYKFADGKNNPEICSSPINNMEDLIRLAQDTHDLLNSLNILHFPIYGSLWGALRYRKPLPWDNDFDFALIHSNLTAVNEEHFIQHFKSNNIEIYYRPWFGTYRVTRATARGDLMIFKKYSLDNSWMVRVGFESYAFFLNYRRFHQFPTRLISEPYSNVMFCDKNMTSPHEGLEIQKHFYPNDWWKEAKPRGC